METPLRNALQKREFLKEQLEKARVEVRQVEHELALVENFLNMYRSFSTQDTTEVMISGNVLRNVIIRNGSTSRTTIMTPSTSRNSKKEDVAEAARRLIKARGAPIGRSELYKLLTDGGMIIEGSDPEMVLSTMLWRMKDRVVRLKSGGYWLTEVPNWQVGYTPGLDDDDIEPPES